MTTLGMLTVRGVWRGEGVEAVTVSLVRPPVTRLFIGQNPEAVVKTVPYLFTLCAHAQRAAAQAALAVAAGEARRPVDDGELWIEFLHENFWRLLLDWPLALGLPPEKEAFAAWRAARLGAERVDATRQLLSGTLQALAERSLERLGGHGCVIPDALTHLNPDAWLAYWQGCSGELPAQHRPPSLLAAYRARLAEVELAARALADEQAYPVAAFCEAGWGVGQTLTARGVLTHAVHVEAGTIRNYRVWSPTDCHFADHTGLANLLADRRFDDIVAAKHGLEQAVLALDPCLPYVVELSDA